MCAAREGVGDFSSGGHGCEDWDQGGWKVDGA